MINSKHISVVVQFGKNRIEVMVSAEKGKWTYGCDYQYVSKDGPGGGANRLSHDHGPVYKSSHDAVIGCLNSRRPCFDDPRMTLLIDQEIARQKVIAFKTPQLSLF